MAERSTGARQSDEEILAALDAAPDAFAAFYRRHVAELLRDFVGRTNNAPLAADLCAETFAAALDGAHRFDPSQGSAAAWLFELAERELAHAERIGAPRDRARRRLGLAPLQPPRDALAGHDDLATLEPPGDPPAGRDAAAPGPVSDFGRGFVADLEEELVAAARFRAQRRSSRLELPRPSRAALRAAVTGAAALALVAAFAALVLRGGEGDDERAAAERSATVLPPTAKLRLAPMHPLAQCAEPARHELDDAAAVHGIALLSRPQRTADELPFAPRLLPIGTFDPRSTRRPAHTRLWSTIHVVPSLDVATDGRCASHVGRGLCLVADEREFACFTADEVEGGRALARTTADTVVGVVPDRVDRATIHGYGPPASADAVENVYEARIDDVPGSDLEVTFSRPDPDGCRRTVTSDLLSEVALLRDEPRRGVDLPQAAHDALRHWQLDAVVEEGARYWGGERAVDFWAVPVVPRGRPKCAPASRVCIVAVGDGSGAAQCMLGGNRRGRNWWLGGPRSGRSVIFGTLPDGVRGVRVTHDGATADIHARGNVFGGLLPFSFRVRDVPRVKLLR